MNRAENRLHCWFNSPHAETTMFSQAAANSFTRAAEQEDFGKKERREKAVAFLDSPELLMMYAQSQGDVSGLSILYSSVL